MPRTPNALVAALLLPVLLLPGCTESSRLPRAETPADQGSSTTGVAASPMPTTWTIGDPRVTESSGLARSPRHAGVLYTHNDRGNPAHLFAVDPDGTRAVLRADAPAQDWEDIASTPDGRLWVGDIGDNDLRRSSVRVEVIEEPDVLVSASVPTTSYTLVYPEGASYDAEALLVDPRDNRLYVVTKDPVRGRIFRARLRLDPSGTNQLRRAGRAPHNVTGGDFSPDGRLVVLRNQGRLYFYRDLGGEPTEVTLDTGGQGESVTFTADGQHVLVGGEGKDSRVTRVDVPTIGGDG